MQSGRRESVSSCASDATAITRFRSWLVAFGGVGVLAFIHPTGGCSNASDGEDRRSTDRPVSTGADARWIDGDFVSTPGFSQSVLTDGRGVQMNALSYRASGFNPEDGPVWFVMHGASRDVDRYVRIAAPVAERYDALVLVLHFSSEQYPRSSDYTLGAREVSRVRLKPREHRQDHYRVIERAFDATLELLGGQQRGYYMFGHSAGAQFTHRLVTFLPDARLLGAVAANAGWYTLPTRERQREHEMPFGLAGSDVDDEALAAMFDVPMAILLGEYDTASSDDDELLRDSHSARAQGTNRLERGRHYFNVATDRAMDLGAELAWSLHVVSGAEHDAAQMIDSAGALLFAPGAAACNARSATSASAADGLFFNEVLADPPAGDAGDANRDGVRDPAHDEFVEIFNGGDQPVCVTGWTLGDASRRDRHVFPIGSALEPGQVLVVFGGGVPTGSFDDAVVQTAERGLNLTNAGDVLTLRDAAGEDVLKFSWGDAAGERPSRDHWAGDLSIDASISRAADRTAEWRRHDNGVDGQFSPGSLNGAAGRSFENTSSDSAEG